jgi:DNA-binding GntR family transcriptional regulator
MLPPTMAPIFSTTSLSPAANRTSVEVADLLRRAIIAGEVAPNERLVELDLARDLGTNRAVVRGALALLEQQRLVIREPNRGVRVRAYTAEEAAEILETRATLEGLVARHAARRIDAAGEAKLAGYLGEMQRCHDSGDLLAYSQINTQFHKTILEIAGHETAAMLLAVLQTQAVRYQFRTVLEPGRITRSLGEHRAIFDAIVARDEAAAEHAMHAHIAAVVNTVRAIGAAPHALASM